MAAWVELSASGADVGVARGIGAVWDCAATSIPVNKIEPRMLIWRKVLALRQWDARGRILRGPWMWSRPIGCGRLLVDFLGGYAEEVGELTPNYRERVGHKDALDRGRGPLDERRILLDCGGQFCSLKVENCMLRGEPLTGDGGSRYKGVNSLKSSEDLWGPVRWHSRFDPFPYSEPLTNLASYFGARGISDKVPKNLLE
ncbi:hypothetical protein CRG98_003317 [Punica granatum]|uniref:Uncharacterized protein n=1 Tax=Punica granatum TaxID=22663 RepID=A0A2I0L6F7_PUNGR|nr:hypothetical protein CRG98_003317 [Punica granatum]